jgi:hypothetical protein
MVNVSSFRTDLLQPLKMAIAGSRFVRNAIQAVFLLIAKNDQKLMAVNVSQISC